MNNYFVLNLETGKLELHFEKADYAALPDEKKREIKSNFLWGRNAGCWISRAKEPNLSWARRCAEKLGLQDAGKTGERLSFAEQMERKAERADRRADRYERHATAAQNRGEALQKPLNDMHGDIAFFTQPNISSAAGRAFTNRRNKMFSAFDRGFEELRKSAYWKERASIVRSTAEQKELQDKGFICRRIKEQESNVRKLKKNIEQYERYAAAYEKGETPLDAFGNPVRISADSVHMQLDAWLDRLEVVLDKLGFYQDCLESLGGIDFSRENIKPGYVVKVARLGRGEVISTGPKNCTVRFGTLPLTIAYAEIIEIISAKENAPQIHPYKVGDSFTCHRWNNAKNNTEKITYTIIHVTEKCVSLQCGDERPIVRKPVFRAWSNKWYVSVTDWNDGIWYKDQIPGTANG